MTLFDNPNFNDHERVVFNYDTDTGLKSIIALHNTKLGPALGGCRMKHYDTDDEALTDVLRLSEGMTYKSAMAGLNFGGGKAVIIGDPKTTKTDDLMKAFGRFVNTLGGDYITAEDVGTTVNDMNVISTETDHVTGVTEGTGDPSNSTGFGVYLGILAAVKYSLMLENLKDIHVVVQGIGNVGWNLCEFLQKGGAKISVADINQDALKKAEEKFGATIVDPDEVYGVHCDVFAPCAMGAVVNDTTLDQFNCLIIAGASNNVLLEPRHGTSLKELGILYAPDYVINAGGVIDAGQIIHGFTEEQTKDKINAIYSTLMEIFDRAHKEDKATNLIADEMAKAKLR